LINACIDVTGTDTEPVWVDPAWLEAQGVEQWTEIPLWRVATGTWAVDSAKARRAGLHCRLLSETVADAKAALDAAPPVAHPRQAEHGMAPEREAELLLAWHANR
jgi:hypothetical protein